MKIVFLCLFLCVVNAKSIKKHKRKLSDSLEDKEEEMRNANKYGLETEEDEDELQNPKIDGEPNQEEEEDTEDTVVQNEKNPEDYLEAKSEEEDDIQEGEQDDESNLMEPIEEDFQLKMLKDLNEIRDKYIDCMKELKSKEFLIDKKREECLGRNFIKLMLDLKYYIMHRTSKGDEYIKEVFKTECYEKAGMDKYFQTGCDILEKDVLDFFWKGLNFVKILENNEKKYIQVHGKIKKHQWDVILELLKSFMKDDWQKTKQINEAKDKIIIEIKIYMDERFKLIEDGKDNEDGAVIGQPKIIHDMMIEQISKKLPWQEKAELVEGNAEQEDMMKKKIQQLSLFQQLVQLKTNLSNCRIFQNIKIKFKLL